MFQLPAKLWLPAYLTCLAAIAGLVSFQLFVPPIVGLSDNGDFPREIGIFGYGPAQKTPPVAYSYVAPTYIQQADFRQPAYEHWNSHHLFVLAAIAISKLIPGDGTLPITTMGFLHLAALIAALARLFWVARRLAVYVGSILILTDVGYAAYGNSFFAENASEIFGIWLIAEAVVASQSRRVGICFTAASLLLICAKPQNAPLFLPIVLYAIFIGRQNSFANRALISAAIFGAAVFMIVGGARPKLETSYNMLFAALLPESRDPRGDLRALGLDPELVRFKGTLTWSPHSGLYEEDVRKMMTAAGPARIAAFYAVRPTRMWRHITTLFPLATQLRPEACANFELSAGQPAGARTARFTAWSRFHEVVLGRVTKYLLFGLLAMLAAGLILRRPLTALLPALALTAFLTAAFGDANEPIKHQYLFNLLLDACFLIGLAAFVDYLQQLLLNFLAQRSVR